MTEQPVIAVNRLKLLEFFDEAPTSSLKHATAIAAVAGEELGITLLVDYLARKGKEAHVTVPCTQGTKSGQRLDAWVDAGSILYQVEVKNWSAHAIGGKVFPIDAPPDQACAHRVEMWSQRWDGGRFNKDSMNKVLLPMRPHCPHPNIEPLIVFWTAMHPTGHAEPLFHVNVRGSVFPIVNVFSMSSYLRQCAGDQLMLQMPATHSRLLWLSEMFPSAGHGASQSDDVR